MYRLFTIGDIIIINVIITGINDIIISLLINY